MKTSPFSLLWAPLERAVPSRPRVPLARLLLLLGLCLSFSSSAEATQVLRQRVTQRGDFVIFGNTLGHDCAANVPAPIVGTVGSCGINTSDSAPDVYWRSDTASDGTGSDGTATASIDIANADARSTAVLQLPEGAAISHAWLYWAATPSASGDKDEEVLLERPGVFSAPLKADSMLTFASNFYRGSKNVTSLLQTHGAGPYRLGGVSSVGLTNASDSNPAAVWWMIVLYELPSAPLRDLAVFDGLDGVSSTTSSTISLSGFLVPTTGYEGKLGVVSLEGDGATSGDSLSWDGSQLSDAMNPGNNFFNGTHSYLGAPVSVPGDLPQLSGAQSSMSGLDMDVLDITSFLRAGQTTATMTASSSQDVFFVTAFVTSIATFIPDLASTVKTVTDLNGGYLVGGDVLEYTLQVRNTGTDAAVDVSVSDPLPSGVTFESGSLEILSGPQAGEQTDALDEDQGEYDAAHHTLTVRLGSGADALQGGTLEAGEESWIRFRVRVKADARGTLSNQALLTFAGLKGSPTRTVPTDADLSAAGASATTINVTPDSDADGILDPLESALGLLPNDADSDDDGVIDGLEPRYQEDSDGDGLLNALDPDADDDGLFDGTEAGLSCTLKDTNVANKRCIADSAPSSTTDPLNPDSDGDGLLDGTEDLNLNGALESSETDPLRPDTDADGVKDGVDLCPVLADPTQADQDADGLGDACDHDQDGDGFSDELDLCPALAQLENLDTDSDGAGDDCDADDDDDGVSDTLDSCPLDPNPDQLDSDEDGRGNVCDSDDDEDGIPDAEDLCPLLAQAESQDLDLDGLGNACDDDDDQDGVADELDNCPLLYNPSQADRNSDGKGDACALDLDEDGIDDEADNCPSSSNSDQADLDEDQLGNVCDPDVDGDGTLDQADNCPVLANPDQADLDRDGLGDLCDDAPQAEDWTLEGSGLTCSLTSTPAPRRHSGHGAWLSLLVSLWVIRLRKNSPGPNPSATQEQPASRRGGHATRALKATSLTMLLLNLASMGVASMSLSSHSAAAQGLNARRFSAATGETLGFSQVGSAFILPAGEPLLGLSSYYAEAPLVATRDEASLTLVGYDLGLDVYATLGLGHRLELGLVLPLSLGQGAGEAEGQLPVTTVSGPALGDVRLILQGLALEHVGKAGQRLGLGLALPVSFPSGAELQFQGEAGMTVEPRLLLSYAGAHLRAGGQVGLLLRPSQTTLGLTSGPELRLASGVGWQLQPSLSLQLEGTAALPVALSSGARVSALSTSTASQALEALLSAQVQLPGGQRVSLGAGPGISRGYGVPAWRVVVGYAYVPKAKLLKGRIEQGRAPVVPATAASEPVAATSARLEKISTEKISTEKISTEKAGAPAASEKVASVPAVAGPSDVDSDGVVDQDDGCPYEAEDKDRYLDRDGCPEADNDGDGLLDPTDRCPQEAEDRDGLGDDDGCPEPDFDRDGFADAQDACPRKPETINGLRDDDGCPDEGRGKVRLAADRLELDEPIFYEIGQAGLLARSLPLLQQVALTLKTLPAEQPVELQVHLDAQAAEKFGEGLAQARAEAVKRYLVQQGVKAEQLSARGYGASQPVAPNDTEANRAKNRRTLFIIGTIPAR